jgi:hypothetical protein
MTTEAWYAVVAHDEPLTQGDLVLDCPVLAWKASSTGDSASPPPLQQRAALYRQDLIVMTQGCDLEHDKVRNVVLCPHLPLEEFQRDWERWMVERKQAVSEKAWRRFCEDIAAGYVWNLTFLDRFEHAELPTDIRVVNFHELFTVPRDFLESVLRERQRPRLRLRAPYREHLSQAFARFFMRVGLPQPVTPTWDSRSKPATPA